MPPCHEEHDRHVLDTSSADVWARYRAQPDRDENIPNVSYAGYEFGERPFPSGTASSTANLSGLIGDGTADDGPAIQRALDAAGKVGAGVVALPAGNFRVDQVLRIRHAGVVLRGAGRQATRLRFGRSLEQLRKPAARWSWTGGLLWIGRDELSGEEPKRAQPIVSLSLAPTAGVGDQVVRVAPGEPRPTTDMIGQNLVLV